MVVKQRTYAVITGASSGIGKEFAYQLAANQMNLVLIARRDDILHAIKANLLQQYSIEIIILKADLTNKNEFEKVQSVISELDDISFLINAAGFGTLGKFYNLPLNRIKQLHHLHTTVPVTLTRLVLDKMIKMHRGTIINISSLEIYREPRLGIVYSAAKEYIRVFSMSLHKQVKKLGIYIQVLCPGYVKTEFHQVGDYIGKKSFSKPLFLIMDPTSVVNASFKALKWKKALVIPGLINKIIYFTLKLPIIGFIIRKTS